MDSFIFHQSSRDSLVAEIVKGVTAHLQQPQVQETTDEYLTRQETAKLLGITLPTLNRYSKLGYLKKYKIGAVVRYRKSEVDSAISNGLAAYKRPQK